MRLPVLDVCAALEAATVVLTAALASSSACCTHCDEANAAAAPLLMLSPDRGRAPRLELLLPRPQSLASRDVQREEMASAAVLAPPTLPFPSPSSLRSHSFCRAQVAVSGEWRERGARGGDCEEIGGKALVSSFLSVSSSSPSSSLSLSSSLSPSRCHPLVAGRRPRRDGRGRGLRPTTSSATPPSPQPVRARPWRHRGKEMRRRRRHGEEEEDRINDGTRRQMPATYTRAGWIENAVRPDCTSSAGEEARQRRRRRERP